MSGFATRALLDRREIDAEAQEEALSLDCRARRQEEHDTILGSRDAIDHLAERTPHCP